MARKASGKRTRGGRSKGFLAATAAGFFPRKKSRKGRGKAARGLTEAQQERVREILSLFLLGITVFLGLACLTAYRGSNLCGPSGEALARALLGTFGYAAWMLVACLGLWGVALFTRSTLPSLSLKGAGLLLCLVSFSALLAHLFGHVSGTYPAGGLLGEYVNSRLIDVGGLGVVGTRIALVVLTLMTFALATDVAYYAALVTGARWVAEKGQAVADARAEAVARREKEARAKPVVVEGEEDEEYEDDEEGEYEEGEYEDDEEEYEAEADGKPKEADTAHSAAEAVSADDALPARRRPPIVHSLRDDAEPATATAADAEAEPDDAEGEERDVGVDDEDEVSGDELDWEEDDLEQDDELDDLEDEDELLDDEEEGEDEEDDEAEWEEDELEVDDEDEAWEDDVSGDDDLATVATGPRVKEVADGQVALLPDDGEETAEPAPPKVTEYVFPTEELLDDQEAVDQAELDELLAEKTETLERTLSSFKIEARCVEIQKGPVISMFEMELAPGIKVERVRSLEDDLAIALRARTVRIVAPIPGKNTIGIEVPNPIRETVRLKPLLHSKEFGAGTFALPIFVGRDAAGRPMVFDLAKMPHLLVAGATGSGKSVCLNTVICSFLFTRTPEQVKLILIDPKMVEMSQFASAPHLACPVVTDMKRAPGILEWAVNKMEERYRLLAKAGVRNIYSFNKLGERKLRERFGDAVEAADFPRQLPFIVIIVDELADLMMVAAKDVETSITRLAAKSRAVGIHIILATQRPSTNVITGLIKANLPTRIAFMVSSKIDSRVILDVNGAEQLLGQGDMLFLPPHSSHVVRGQCTYMSEEEVGEVMLAVKSDAGPAYVPELVQRRSDNDTDPSEVDTLYDAATRFIIGTRRGSASLLQRKFAIGYTRASRLIDLMAEEGVLGEYKGSQAREVQLTLEEWVALNPEAREAAEEEEPV